MAKIRVYELARELSKDNKNLEEVIRGLGIPIKNYMSTLSPDEAQRVRAAVSGGGGRTKAPARPAASGGRSGGAAGSSSPPAKRTKTVIRRRGAEVQRRRAEREAEKAAESRSDEQGTARTHRSERPEHRDRPTHRGPSSRDDRAPRVENRRSASRPQGDSSRPRHGDPSGARQSEKGASAEAKKVAPEVGTVIALPPNTRRLAGGMAERLERAKSAPPPVREPKKLSREARPSSPTSRSARPGQERGGPVREVRPPRDRDQPTTPTSKAPTAEPPAGTATEPAPTDEAVEATTETIVGGRRVVRNEDGVIVGVHSRQTGPKIQGFIQLAPPKRRQQVIITDAAEEERKGRATQRKQREERAQAQGRRKKPLRRGQKGGGGGASRVSTVAMSEEKKRIRVDEAIQVSDLAHQMGQKASTVLRTLWGMGLRGITINNAVDFETAEMVATEFGYTVENVAFQEDEFITTGYEGDEELRAPVVTVMGHVDHGKTSLLDYIRESRVAPGEAGGITQHIGAYKVGTDSGSVVFLDTPGHEAFTAMRKRGAQVTDIVVLVVAADDGVMPTTVEAIKHARDANSPIVVAVNKIDKPEANPGRVKQALMEHGIIGEEFGGETPILEVSAKTGQGIDNLLETLALQAEVLELRAPAEGRALGTVLEARIDKGRGTVATVLVQAGTLCKGDILVANEFHGKVRGLYAPGGGQLDKVGPSTPVEILGLSGVPAAGDTINVVESDKDAKALVSHRRELRRRKESVRTGPSIQELLNRNKVPVLKIVLKADVQGSAQALAQALEELSTKKVKVEVIKAEVGMINETDVKYARAGDGVIFGFNVKTTGKAAPIADAEGVTIHTFSVIYDATDHAKELMVGLLEPEYREREQGEAEIRALFPIPRLGVVAGCRVTRGLIQRTSHVRVVRDGEILHVGTIGSLRVHKDDVREVKDGFECGIVVDGFSDIQEGDVIQSFDVEAIPPSL